ncbi:hypothetical protein COHA_010464 [Chlorella ohadii]|uniref:F-box domain-containing protein n=1 Tax=Chlorella ohadii TaxID=2649997 RepID=A0AAD5DG03_9CHLO|nr:hypothetical protein COHA_010464 [Chlorella ohadii]
MTARTISRSISAPSEGRRVALPPLPDSALIAVFGQLSLHERLELVPPVCKRWRELCSAPSLVSRVALGRASGAEALPRLRSLLLWLARHAAHVEELSLTIGDLSGDASEPLQLLAAAAASCGPALRQLSIRLEGQQQPRLVLSSWLCGLTHLSSLDACADTVHIPVSLVSMTAMQTLALAGSTIEGPPDSHKRPWLPPGLTYLRWACRGTSSLPEQVGDGAEN